MTQRMVRTGIWVAAGLVVLFAICALLLKLLFDPNDYRADVERAFFERTGRELRLAGDLELKLLPRLALATGPFTVANAPGFGEEPLLAVDDARLDLRLWPLLRRRVEIGTVRLDAPVVNLRIDARGRNNWQTLLDRATKEPAATEAPAETSTSLSVAALRVRAGRVTYDDRAARSRIDLTDLTLDTGALAATRPISVDLAFAFTTAEKQVPRRLSLSATLEREASSTWIVQRPEGTLTWPTRAGRSLPVEFSATTLRYDPQKRRLELPEYVIAAGSARLSGALSGSVGEPATSLEGPLRLERVNPRELLETLGIEPPRTRDAAVLSSLAMQGKVAYGPRGFALNSIDGQLDDTKLEGSLSRGSGENPALGFALALDAIDLDRYLAPPADATAAKAEVDSSPGAMQTLRAAGTLRAGRLRGAGFELHDLRAKLSARDGKLAAEPLDARVFDGRMSTRVRADMRKPVTAYDIDLRLDGIDIEALLQKTLDSRRLTGRSSLNARLTAAGSTAAQLNEGLRGTFDTSIVDGSFVGMDLWYEIERAVQAAQGRAPAARPANPRTKFDRFAARGTIADGRIGLQRFDGANDFLTARGDGEVDYRAAQCDLDIVARLERAPDGTIAGQPVARLTGLDIPVTVRGPLADPKVRPDVAGLLSAAAKQQLRQEGEKVEKKLKEKVGDALKDLFGQ
jgi:AsmA protein